MIHPNLLAAGVRSPAPDRLISPRMRVIIDNDFSGDPDDLFELVHHILSPSIQIPVIIGSHLAEDDPWDPSQIQATNACHAVEELLAVMGLSGGYRIAEGSNIGLESRSTPIPSEAAQAIVTEALRDDTDLPLYVVCGAGLTDLASAYLLEPSIAGRFTVIWIGGAEYPDLAPMPPNVEKYEYNHGIDPIAAQVIFNDSELELWHVPRNAYREHLMTHSELLTRVRPQGALGSYLYNKIAGIYSWQQEGDGHGIGETYIMGDSPLVTLTALQASFHAMPSSSTFVARRAPLIDNEGQYVDNPLGRTIRIYTHTDVRMTFEDFFLKLQSFAGPAS